ncbi:MAG: glycosyltransferase family 1 protein [Candidatus Moranbacteria bacterium]|nr:glycosyltransferase family 1 protein [Candidatus Moranbacteria bacterium]
MRIGIDLRCLEEEKISGVGEYALEIVRNLLEADGKNQYVIFSNSYKQKSKNFGFLEKYPQAELKRFRYPNKILNLFLWYFGWPKLDKLIGGADIFFAPNINFLAISGGCKLVSTFHDLSFERFPEFFTAKTRLWHYYFVNPRRLAKKSSRIFAVSQSTGNDLAELYKIDEKKTGVIRHGISGDYQIISRNDPKLLEVQKKYNLPYKFILYLGNIEPRKNVRSLVKAYKKLRKVDPTLEKYKLVLAGNKSPQCRDIINGEENDIFSIGYIDREDKPFVYNLASLFVYPSFFEGFGLPILEAMACGTPVIASNNSSIPEVVGNAAILVDPNRPQEISEAMKNILGSDKLYTKLRERGLAQAKKFNWKECAEKTINLFQKI